MPAETALETVVCTSSVPLRDGFTILGDLERGERGRGPAEYTSPPFPVV